MGRIRIFPYKSGSRGAKVLARALGAKVLNVSKPSKFKPRPTDVIINWGSSSGPSWSASCGPFFANSPDLVTNASDKLVFFETMKEAGLEDIIPQFWTSAEAIPDSAFPVVCRTVLSGHSGKGIHIAACRGDLVSAPLYTRYVKKKDEYRVHCGVVSDPEEVVAFSVQRKARRLDHPNPNWEVRNHANGFIYTRTDVAPPECVLDAARRALGATGLDFGAVDVIYNEKKAKAYVLPDRDWETKPLA